MATDDVQIANLALARIGVSLKIASLTERTKEAIEIRNVFANVRDRVLEAAPWPFARRFVQLAKTGDNQKLYRWLFQYGYPTDCVALRTLLPPVPANLIAGVFPGYVSPWSGESFSSPVAAVPLNSSYALTYYTLTGSFRQWIKAYPVRFELGVDAADTRIILTDQDQAVAEYTARVTNPTLYTGKFTSVFAWALAAEIALPLAKTVEYSRNAAAMYEKELNEEIAKQMNEEKQDALPDSEFVRARL